MVDNKIMEEKTEKTEEMKKREAVIARFVLLKEKLGYTQGKFGKALGISDVSVSRMESGQTTINEKHIKLISGVFGISEDWLRDGIEPMYKDGNTDDVAKMMEVYNSLSPEGREKVLEYTHFILDKENKAKGVSVNVTPPTDENLVHLDKGTA
jgi:transcriptional regulator with XRE-family HTH domain